MSLPSSSSLCDIEGHAVVALSGFSLQSWKPALVLTEDHIIHLHKRRVMRHHGYRLLMRTGLNSWYVPAEFDYTYSFAARFEYICKYFLGLPLRKFRYLQEAW